MSDRPSVILLGPQGRVPTVAGALSALGVDPKARIAVVSAGWEERENELDEFERHIGARAVNLEVYQRVEEIYRRDPSFRELVLSRHDRHHQLQDVYRSRLGHALGAARELLESDGPDWLLDPERDAAIEAVRVIDAHHIERARSIQQEFRADHSPAEHPLVAACRARFVQQLDECAALCIAGGNVSILLNRLRVAGVMRIWSERAKPMPIVAWGAGAMVLAERIVLFHDNPPQGVGTSEILEPGFGVAGDIVPLPHAARRLRLEDRARVELFARRFQPARCVALDDGALAEQTADGWRFDAGTRALDPSGAVCDVGGAA